MKFTKMHGCGNDYVYINGFEEKINPDEKPELVRHLSDRHFGIGGDGVIFINPSEDADFEMEMWNADGTRAEMCGNGIRCVSKYVYDHHMTDSTEISIVSAGAVKYLSLHTENGVCTSVKVDMGEPILEPAKIPVDADEIHISCMGLPFTCVSMGNPHAVTYVDDVNTADVHGIGAAVEKDPLFPKKTNVEFIHVVDRKHIDMRVWERGTGETLACGTGACASVVSTILNGLTDNTVEVKLLGGTLVIGWEGPGSHVFMTGPATQVFEGEI